MHPITGGNGDARGIFRRMRILAIHLACIALVVVDLVARTWRFQWILRGMRFDVPFGEVLTVNVVGDAASAVTPLRVGGEPARLAALAYARVPLTAGIVAVLLETVVMWPPIIAAAGWLALIYAPRWWRQAEPQLAHTASAAWPWLAGFILVGVVAWLATRRAFPSMSQEMRRGTRRAFAYARRMPAWPLAAGIPLTLVSLAARVAILPLLALTLPHPPPLGPLSFASFTLLYGQLLLPTPSGAGVVEIGFLGGAVGAFGGHHAALLLYWRVYTTFVLVALGVLLGLRAYGRRAVAAMLRGRVGAAPPPRDEGDGAV